MRWVRSWSRCSCIERLVTPISKVAASEILYSHSRALLSIDGGGSIPSSTSCH